MKKQKINSIIFVCLGNICRSPLAQAVAQNLNEKYGLGLTVDSAGTGSWHIGEAPCENSQIVAKQRGLDISLYKARQVHKNDFESFDLVIGLDSKNIANLKKMGCAQPLLLGSFGFDEKDVPDPYFFDGFEGFDKVFDMIENCVEKLFRDKKLIP
jgi:protein-tyrosine phosphatase